MDATAPEQGTCTAFAGTDRVGAGEPRAVALALKALADTGDSRTVLVFDDETGRQVEFDLRGSADEVAARFPEVPASADEEAAEQPEAARRTRGRPRLGVVGREVTLLPRHWEWLNAQPGGASVALRKLVEQARRENAERDRTRTAQDAAYRFMSSIAGNEPGYEEAVRALYAGDAVRFAELTDPWPPDVRHYARQVAGLE